LRLQQFLFLACGFPLKLRYRRSTANGAPNEFIEQLRWRIAAGITAVTEILMDIEITVCTAELSMVTADGEPNVNISIEMGEGCHVQLGYISKYNSKTGAAFQALRPFCFWISDFANL